MSSCPATALRLTLVSLVVLGAAPAISDRSEIGRALTIGDSVRPGRCAPGAVAPRGMKPQLAVIVRRSFHQLDGSSQIKPRGELRQVYSAGRASLLASRRQLANMSPDRLGPDLPGGVMDRHTSYMLAVDR